MVWRVERWSQTATSDPEYAETDFVTKYDVPRDVIVFAHNGDSADTVAKKLGDYKHYSVGFMVLIKGDRLWVGIWWKLLGRV